MVSRFLLSTDSVLGEGRESPGENFIFSGQIEASFDSYYCLHVLLTTQSN